MPLRKVIPRHYISAPICRCTHPSRPRRGHVRCKNTKLLEIICSLRYKIKKYLLIPCNFQKYFVSLHQLPLEVSMCYGTLPRGGYLPSVVFYMNNPSLKKSLFFPFSYSHTSLIVAPTFNLATIACLIKRSEAPLVLLIIIRADCFIP